MPRQLRFLVAVSLAVAAGACSPDSEPPLAPGATVVPPDSLGRLVYSTPVATLFTPVWSSLTDRIYFVDTEKGMLELDPASGAVRTLDEDGYFLVMAPNGRALYYHERLSRDWSLLQRFDLETERITAVSDSTFASAVASNGDGLVAYTRLKDEALVIADPSGSSAEVVASRGYPHAFSPDDREILYSRLYPSLSPGPLQIRNIGTGLVREIPTLPGRPLGGAYWGPRGITIAFFVVVDYPTWRLGVRIGDIDRMMFSSSEWIDSASWSPGGSRLAFLTYGSDRRGRILTAWVVELETSKIFRVAHGFDQSFPTPDPEAPTPLPPGGAMTFSPDGRSLAFTSAGRIFIAPID